MQEDAPAFSRGECNRLHKKISFRTVGFLATTCYAYCMKKLMLAALSTLALFALVGCGGSSEPAAEATGPAPVTVPNNLPDGVLEVLDSGWRTTTAGNVWTQTFSRKIPDGREIICLLFYQENYTESVEMSCDWNKPER